MTTEIIPQNSNLPVNGPTPLDSASVIVIKRDGSKENFQFDKIENAVRKAFKATRNNDQKLHIYGPSIYTSIANDVFQKVMGANEVWIEEIQNLVEDSLMNMKEYRDVAKNYIIYRALRSALREQQGLAIKEVDSIQIPWGEIGYIVFKRTYARRLKEGDANSPLEEYVDTVKRIIRGCNTQLRVGFTSAEERMFATDLLNMKCSVAGRFLWQLGTHTVDRLGLASLQNCACVCIANPIQCFTWIFDMLMLGEGVGVNISREYVNKLPLVSKNRMSISHIGPKEEDKIPDESDDSIYVSKEEILKAMNQKLCSTTSNQQESIVNAILDKHKSVTDILRMSRDSESDHSPEFLETIITEARVLLSLMDDGAFIRTKRDNFSAFLKHLDLNLGQVVFETAQERWARLVKEANNATLRVKDSREGWVELLEKVLEAYFITGEGFTYTTIDVRKKGSIIRGFGGIASGSEFLYKGMENICSILNKRIGQSVKPIDCLDIVCIIGQIVVSGNVRRSAIIALGDADDLEYLRAKRWDLGGIPNWRAMSNNSVICSDTSKLPSDFWEGYNGNGEPYGLVNLDLARKIGRIKDGEKYPDPEVAGFNPCAEQPLSNFETCCLAEIFLPNIKDFEELKRVATSLYRVCKHSLTLSCHHKQTEEIVHRNMRMGIGVSGVLQSTQEQLSWLSPLYEYLREYDIKYSQSKHLPISIKLTTVKPSGTLSLLAGITPGCHPSLYKFYIRRVRMASNNPLVEICRSHGYHIENQILFDQTEDKSTVVISFPCKSSETATIAAEMSAVKELEVVKWLQTEWSDNAVSCTIYYTKDELDNIKKWLSENYTHSVKSVSFLLRYDHCFQQAPYEEISEQQYNDMVAKTKPIGGEAVSIKDFEALDDSGECRGGMCPVR